MWSKGHGARGGIVVIVAILMRVVSTFRQRNRATAFVEAVISLPHGVRAWVRLRIPEMAGFAQAFNGGHLGLLRMIRYGEGPFSQVKGSPWLYRPFKGRCSLLPHPGCLSESPAPRAAYRIPVGSGQTSGQGSVASGCGSSMESKEESKSVIGVTDFQVGFLIEL